MALRLSAALRNYINKTGAMKRAMSNCVLKVYSGSQPATAEAAPTGTLLCTYSQSSGALTREVLATGSVTIAGATGSIDTIKLAVGGGTAFDILGAAVAFDTDINVTATNVATQINNNPANAVVVASTTGASGVITFTARRGAGATMNGWVPSGTGTTLTVGTAVNIGSGVAGVTAVNALRWGESTAGVLSKLASQTWSGVAGVTGTAGWFRFEASTTDAGSLDSSEAVLRMDGSVATSGGELNMTPTAITSGATQTITSFTITLPTA